MKWNQPRIRLTLFFAVSLGLARYFLGEPSPIPGSVDLKFSHRFHLKEANATCEDCHVGARSSTSSSDRNLPDEQACLKCHDGTKAGKACTVCHTNPQSVRPLQLPPREIHFNHHQHLQLGNLAPILAAAMDSGKYMSKSERIRPQLETENACVACHRGLQEADFSTGANLPQMADCLVCHTEIDPPFSCSFCHTTGAKVKPSSHTADFIDLHSSRKTKLDRQSCKICHGIKFQCMGCH
jgi:Cytochrome c7 and related cytochrome c